MKAPTAKVSTPASTNASTLLMVAIAAMAGAAHAAQPSVTQRIEPATIALGDAARLTITESGDGAAAITPPMVSGLEFVAIAQSQQVESINGVTHSTSAVTYQVIPRQTGVFTIPGEGQGSSPVVLTVNTAGGTGANPSRGAGQGSGAAQTIPGTALPQAAAPGVPAGPTHLTADGSAFVRLRLAKHDLYVGESIPVDIEVGTRDGMVASLNGLPTLNGDAFTLEKLASQPQRSAAIIDGQPFTVFTWHSALVAVKPGELSLTMETPLTVRVRAPRPDSGPFGDSALNQLFDDPMLQNFFGTTTREKEVTVTSSPAAFTVLALPTAHRPADFSGAVGHFTVSSDLSQAEAAAGDPVTLRMRVSGEGDFDRVNSRMLHDVDRWKTYAPTATFKPSDQIGDRGEKTFEQPVIAMQPGKQSLPGLSFSWFDPTTRRYEEAHTSPLSMTVSSAPTDGTAARSAQPAPGNAALAAATGPGNGGSAGTGAASAGLRPDHVDTGPQATSLMPHYYQPEYLVAPSLLALGFLGAGLWVRHRDRLAEHLAAARTRAAALQTEPLLRQMDEAGAASNAELFFRSARLAVMRALAPKWQVEPDKVTREEVDARLGAQSDVARLFELADEASYSTVKLTALDVMRWKQVVLRQINGEQVNSEAAA